MKRFLSVILSITLVMALVTGCSGVATSGSSAPASPNGSSPASAAVSTSATTAAISAATTTTPEASPSGTVASSATTQAATPSAAYPTPSKEPSANAPVVYMTKAITPEGLMAIYKALGMKATGKVAVKLATGEPPASNYLRPELIKDLVQSLDATIVECNTAYGGQRASTAMHMQVAKDHGFTAIADVDIMDSEGEVSLPVVGGELMKENVVGSHFKNYDFFVVLSHFKGHMMAGYGGALKNISIGIASPAGKSLIHTGTSRTNPFGGDQDSFLKRMAEAGKSVVDSLNGKILYINVMNRLSIDCDCNGNPAEPDMHDVGILASLDPVALDQACIDIVATDPDGKSLMDRLNSRNGLLTLEHAAEIGLGSREYKLVSIDD